MQKSTLHLENLSQNLIFAEVPPPSTFANNIRLHKDDKKSVGDTIKHTKVMTQLQEKS
jgi:hypothetical protein